MNKNLNLMIVTIFLVILVIPNIVKAQNGSVDVIDFDDINTEKLLDKEKWGNSLPIFLENGSYVFLRADGIQYNDKNHKKIWRFTLEEGGVHDNPLIFSNSIFIGDTSGNITRISLDGKLIWQKQFGWNIYSELVEINKTIVFDVWDLPKWHRMMCINIDGKIIWESETIHSDRNPKVIDNKILFIESLSEDSIACMSDKGTIIWNIDFNHTITTSLEIINYEVVFGLNNSKIIFLDVNTGNISRIININQIAEGHLFFMGDLLIFHDNYKSLLFYNNYTGEGLWGVETGFIINPDIMKQNDFIYSLGTVVAPNYHLSHGKGYVYKIDFERRVIDTYLIKSERGVYLYNRPCLDAEGNIFVYGIKDTLVLLTHEDVNFALIFTTYSGFLLLSLILTIIIFPFMQVEKDKKKYQPFIEKNKTKIAIKNGKNPLVSYVFILIGLIIILSLLSSFLFYPYIQKQISTDRTDEFSLFMMMFGVFFMGIVLIVFFPYSFINDLRGHMIIPFIYSINNEGIKINQLSGNAINISWNKVDKCKVITPLFGIFLKQKILYYSLIQGHISFKKGYLITGKNPVEKVVIMIPEKILSEMINKRRL